MTTARVLGSPKSPSKHTGHLPQTPAHQDRVPCREDRLEKRRQEGLIHRSHSQTVFSLDLDLRPCLDSPASKLKAKAVSGHDPVNPGEGRPYLTFLLTSRGSELTGQTSSQGTGSRKGEEC